MPRETGFNPAAAELEQQRPTPEQIDWLKKLPVVSFRKAKGSGGQSVNTTSSAAELRWQIVDPKQKAFSPFSPDEQKTLVDYFSAKKGKWNKEEGEAIIVRVSERSFGQNAEDALEQLVEEVKKALTVNAPRIATRPTHASVERRIEKKKLEGRRSRERRTDFE